ncbi:hypothetical protein KP509_01G081500 [Ceratopteris richardii]|nr:hypothetical protein KP509_01G081500 [Ceratopteris richardii]
MGVPIAYLPFTTPFGDAAAQKVREMLTQCFDRVSQAQGIIGNSYEALEQGILEELTQRLKQQQPNAEQNRRWPRSFRTVGPLVVEGTLYGIGGEKVTELSGTSFWREEVAECKEWLDKQPVASVVYVAFGSLKVLTASQVQEVLLGMAASGHRFLMVVRRNAVRSKALTAETFGSQFGVALEEALPPGFLESIQERCKLVAWAPQTMVLAHPSVGGFFSHCGWNSTLESLCCGVPILGWPWLMDQMSNCWLLSDVWKVGLLLECNEANETTKEKVEIGIRKLMEGSLAERLRAQAMKIKDQAREAARMNHGVLSLAQEIHLLACNS